MKDEIDAAVSFVTRLIRQKNQISEDQISGFSQNLANVLLKRFENHWYHNQPTKGQAYRCIRINEFQPVDPVLDQAARDSGMRFESLGLTEELTLWVDPSDVCCRFGEAKGSFITVATFHGDNKRNNADKLDIDELLQRHQDLKNIEMKKILYGHNRSTLKTYKRQSFSPVSPDMKNKNMSNLQWPSNSYTWKAKSINSHLKHAVRNKPGRLHWQTPELVAA